MGGDFNPCLSRNEGRKSSFGGFVVEEDEGVVLEDDICKDQAGCFKGNSLVSCECI